MEGEKTGVGGVDLELTDRVSVDPWFGFQRAEATAAPRSGTPEDRTPVVVQTVPAGRWGPDHVERLLLTAPTGDRDTSGLVPVAAVSENLLGEKLVVSLRTDAPRFQERLDFRTPPPWNEGAGVALAAALAVEKGHSLGLRHGALQPRDVIVAGSELGVAGMGLSLGGTPEPRLEMAPEVAQSGVPTVAGDVYSLGRLLEAGTSGDPTTPSEIAAIVADATAEDVQERIPSAIAFADRLKEAGGDVMRAYTPMIFADSPLFEVASDDDVAPIVAPVPPISTSTAPPIVPQSGRGVVGRALPWLVGAGLAGVIGFGLWAAATSGDGDSTTPTTASTSTVATSTVTTSPTSSSATTPPETSTTTDTSTSTTSTSTTSTSTTSTSTTSTSSSTTTEPPTTLPTPPDVPAIPASSAGLEIVHGLSQPAVDAYLDGDLLVEGFEPGEIAGPLQLPAGTYDVQLFAAADDPPPSTEGRSDEPLLSQSVPISGEPQAGVVTTDADGGPTILTFADDVGPIDPGEGRLSIRNPTNSTILVTLEPEGDGRSVERQAVSPGAVLSSDLPSGNYQMLITEEDGSPLLATVVSNTEGELTSATFLRDGEPRLILQRIGGLGSPPDGIPTGTGGLLPGSEDPTTGLLIAAVGALGLFAMVGRQRLVNAGRR